MGARNSQNGAKKRTELGLVLEASVKEILAHVKGETNLPTRRIVLPDEVNVKHIRTKAGIVASRVCARVLHQFEDATGMGAGV